MKSRRPTLRVLAVALSLLALTAAGFATAPQLWWGRADPGDIALITSHQAAVNRLLNVYNFNYERWEVHKLLCACLRHYRIYEGISTNEYREVTEFILVVPVPGEPDGQLGLIPVWYEGTSFGGNADDLHNVAIFNRVVEAERMQAASESDWLTLALLYMTMTGQQPQLVDATNREAVARARLSKRDWPRIPEVTPLPDGGAQVDFVNFTVEKELVSWSFRFDAQGLLRRLQSTSLTRPKSGLPNR